DQAGPERCAGARAAAVADGVLVGAVADDERHAGVRRGVGGHVRHSPVGGDAGQVVLVAGPCEALAEPAAGGLELRSGGAEGEAPGGLVDIGARRVGGVEAGAAGGENERVGGRQVRFLDGREGTTGQALDHLARLADGADVAGGGNHGYVPGGGSLEGAV